MDRLSVIYYLYIDRSSYFTSITRMIFHSVTKKCWDKLLTRQLEDGGSYHCWSPEKFLTVFSQSIRMVVPLRRITSSKHTQNKSHKKMISLPLMIIPLIMGNGFNANYGLVKVPFGGEGEYCFPTCPGSEFGSFGWKSKVLTALLRSSSRNYYI